MDKFGRMNWHFYTKSGLGYSEDVTVNDTMLDVKTRIIKNIGSPTEPTDAVNKQYVDAILFRSHNEVSRSYVDDKISSLKKEINDLVHAIKKLDVHMLKINGLESNFVSYEEVEKLIKDEFLIEKSKLIGCLRDLISGKIKRPSRLENSDVAKIDKTELEAVLEGWRGK